jgi:hypothetical protein
MKVSILKAVPVALFLTVGIAGCGSDSNDGGNATSNNIIGTLHEWAVEVDATTALAGDVTFTVAKGTTESLTINLTPGTYQLVCNLPDHYEAGIYISQLVRVGRGSLVCRS